MSYRLAGLGSQLAVVLLASMTLDRGELLFVVLGLLLGWNLLLIVTHLMSRHRPRPDAPTTVVQVLVPLVLFATAMAISS